MLSKDEMCTLIKAADAIEALNVLAMEMTGATFQNKFGALDGVLDVIAVNSADEYNYLKTDRLDTTGAYKRCVDVVGNENYSLEEKYNILCNK